MLAEPRRADLEDRPLRTARHRAGLPPDVGVVMRHPAPRAVEVFRDVGAIDAQLLGQIDQWKVALGEVGYFHRPVVDLRIAIDRPVGRPGRVQVLVPNPLKVGWLAARARRRDQQVAAELEIKRSKPRIPGGRLLAEALVDRQIARRIVVADFQRNAFRQRLIVTHMVIAQLGIGRLAQRGEVGGTDRRRILAVTTRTALRTVVTRGSREQQHDAVAIFRHHRCVGELKFSSMVLRDQPRFETHAFSVG